MTGTELIIAADALSAEAFAVKRGWQTYEGNRRLFDRREGANWIPVRYVSAPDMLRENAREAPIWIGPFPGGLPAPWVRALEDDGRRIANAAELLECGLGDFRPMKDAPLGRPFLAFMSDRVHWLQVAIEAGNPDHVYEHEDGTYWRRALFTCWRELPPNPPAFLVRAALESENAKTVSHSQHGNSAIPGD